MAKLGENTPHIIDATVDFMASSQAFREYLKKLPPDNTIPPALTDEQVWCTAWPTRWAAASAW